MALVLGDPELHIFIGGAPADAPELQARYARLTKGSPQAGTDWLNWILRLREQRALVGTVQATVSHDNLRTRAEVAWVVGLAWQGQGLAQEAACALLAWLDEQGVGLTVARIHPGHSASARVAQAAGLLASEETYRGETVWRRTLPA